MVASTCGLDSSLIRPVSSDSMATGFARPIYGLLDISKAVKELYFTPLSLDEALHERIDVIYLSFKKPLVISDYFNTFASF